MARPLVPPAGIWERTALCGLAWGTQGPPPALRLPTGLPAGHFEVQYYPSSVRVPGRVTYADGRGWRLDPVRQMFIGRNAPLHF